MTTHYDYFAEVVDAFVALAKDEPHRASVRASFEGNVTRATFAIGRRPSVTITLANDAPRPVTPESAAHLILEALQLGTFVGRSEWDLSAIINLAALR